MFLHFWQKFENSKMAAILGERKIFLKIANSTLLRYPVDRIFRQNCSISHGLGDRHIYVFCYIAITQEVKAITINKNTKQATDPINLHTKFYKDELNCNKFYCNLIFYKLNTYLILTSACLVLWSKTHRPTRIF